MRSRPICYGFPMCPIQISPKSCHVLPLLQVAKEKQWTWKGLDGYLGRQITTGHGHDRRLVRLVHAALVTFKCPAGRQKDRPTPAGTGCD